MNTPKLKYNLEETKALWNQTETMEISPELATVRGWLMDALEMLSTPESFDEWIDTDNIEVLKRR